MNHERYDQVGGVVFPLPPNIQLLPLSASSFSLAQSAITFRVVLGGVNEVDNNNNNNNNEDNKNENSSMATGW